MADSPASSRRPDEGDHSKGFYLLNHAKAVEHLEEGIEIVRGRTKLEQTLVARKSDEWAGGFSYAATFCRFAITLEQGAEKQQLPLVEYTVLDMLNMQKYESDAAFKGEVRTYMRENNCAFYLPPAAMIADDIEAELLRRGMIQSMADSVRRDANETTH